MILNSYSSDARLMIKYVAGGHHEQRGHRHLEVELRRIGPHYVVAAVRGNRQLKSLGVFYNSRTSLKCQTNEKIAHF